MVRLVIALVFICTFVGAIMPGKRVGSGSQAADAVKKQARTDWGSAAEPLESTASASQYDTAVSSGPIRLHRESNGHFYADVQVNQAVIHFLVDTGASGIALSSADARLAQVATTGLSEPVGRGASGIVMGREVRLDRVQLGSQQALHVAATVIDGGEQSLLGQSFLSGYKSVEISDDVMTLR